MQLAGSAALNGLLQDCILIDGVAEQLFVDIVEAQASNGVSETFTGDTFIAEEQDCLFDNIQSFFFGGEDLVEHLTAIDLLAPTAADGDLEAGNAILDNIEGAGVDAAAAVVADVGIDVDLAVYHLCDLDGAGSFNLADLAALALSEVSHGNALADDGDIVQVGLDAVIGAAADSDLELMRQSYAAIAKIEAFVDLFGQAVTVAQTVLAGGSLAGNDGTNQRTGTAGGETVFSQEVDEGLNVSVLNTLDFQSQTGGSSNLAGAELFSSFGDSHVFSSGNETVAGDNANVEYIGIALILQAAQTLNALDFFCGQSAFEFNLNYVDESAAFQSAGVGVAQSLQTVLNEVAALALSANQKDLVVLFQTFLARSTHFAPGMEGAG